MTVSLLAVLTVVPSGALAFARLPPLPPPLLLLLLPDVVAVVDAIVTDKVPVPVPPGVLVAVSVNAHVPVAEPALTDQLCDELASPATVPTVREASVIVHLPLLSTNVAVIAAVEPAISVPVFWMVAETVKDALGATLLSLSDDVRETMLKSAAELMVT